MIRENEQTDDLEAPKKMALELLEGKNRWLIKTRWWYTFFILIFFFAYNYFAQRETVPLYDILLIVVLSVFGNILFLVTLRRRLRHTEEEDTPNALTTLATLQLDFDLVLLSLLVFSTGGFSSPLLVLFFFYVVVSTFLIDHEKAFRNTLTAMVLVVVLSFTNEGFIVSPQKMASLIGFMVIMFFAYLVSRYLSRNLEDNEERLRTLLDKFHELSVTDGLTSLYNQTHFFLLLNLQLEHAKRYETPLSVIIFDVDNFKNYNDNNGHIQGSDTLRRVAGLMRTVFRSGDILAKYGGDEFVIILPQSDKVGAFLGAERLREIVEAEDFPGKELQPGGALTISLGLAGYPEHGDTTEQILDKADKALYVAKKHGRNRTVIYSPDLDEELED